MLEVGNIYPRMYAKTFFDGMTAAGEKQVINLLRCAWAGSQKYGALVWSGDIHSSFRSLRNQFAAGLNMGIAGIRGGQPILVVSTAVIFTIRNSMNC